MSYTQNATWNSGGAPGINASQLNNLETQYQEASLSFNPDFITAGFVLSGLVCTKDGSIANKLDVTSGTYYAIQSADSTLRQRKISTTSFTTSTPSTTYFFDVNPDGTTSWATSHSGVTNHLTICSVTTDGSGNISTVTDARVLTISLFPNASIFAGPSIVAQALDVHVTATTLQVILSYTAPVTGMYRVSAHASMGNTSGEVVRFSATYTDPHLGNPTAFLVNADSSGVNAPLLDASGGAVVNISIPTYPVVIWAAVSTAIHVNYIDPGGTPNDYVSAVIERLA